MELITNDFDMYASIQGRLILDAHTPTGTHTYRLILDAHTPTDTHTRTHTHTHTHTHMCTHCYIHTHTHTVTYTHTHWHPDKVIHGSETAEWRDIMEGGKHRVQRGQCPVHAPS